MCILLKLHYAKFDVSGLFCSKVIGDKPLGVGSTPLVNWEGLRVPGGHSITKHTVGGGAGSKS